MRDPTATILTGDALELLRQLPDGIVDSICTSPPYFRARLYGGGQAELGREKTPIDYVDRLVGVFREVRRVLKSHGTCWIVVGDYYSGGGKGGGGTYERDVKPGTWDGITEKGNRRYGDFKPKDLVCIPWMLSEALRADGWWRRKMIIWSKANCFPESCKDRPTSAHEYVLMMAKSPSYFFDAYAIREKAATDTLTRDGAHANPKNWDGGDGTRNSRDVWDIRVEPFKGAHFAVYPTQLASRMVAAATPEGGVCAACGAPYGRVLEDLGPDDAHKASCGADSAGGYAGRATKDFAAAKAQNASDTKRRILEGMRIRRTVGFSPTCACRDGYAVPASVLDPFGGAATTALAAGRAGRDSLSLELVADFVRLGIERLLDPKTKCRDGYGIPMPWRRIRVAA